LHKTEIQYLHEVIVQTDVTHENIRRLDIAVNASSAGCGGTDSSRRNQPTDLVGGQHGCQPAMTLGRRELLFQLSPFEHTDKKEAEGRRVETTVPTANFFSSNR
jgi:hypothetical protein